MPIHLFASAVSGVVTLDNLAIYVACIVALIAIKQWAMGVDLLARLDAASAAAAAPPSVGRENIIPVKSIQTPRDMHGSIVLVVVSQAILQRHTWHLRH